MAKAVNVLGTPRRYKVAGVGIRGPDFDAEALLEASEDGNDWVIGGLSVYYDN